MNFLTAALSALLALLALMVFSMLKRSKSTLLWQMSVVAKEYGHYAAIVTVAVVAALLLTAPPFWWTPALFLILGILFTGAFAWPLASALRLQHQIHARASGEFPADLAISFRTLLAGIDLKPVPYKRLEYRHVGDQSLTLDYYPAQDSRDAPWVLVIHGGGWETGDSSQLAELNSVLAGWGFAVFAINYRLAPQNKWPAPLDDAQAAVEFIRSRAAQFGLSPARWAVLGRSAGGQIAGVLAYTMTENAPRGLVSLYGPSDMFLAWKSSKPGDILEPRTLLKNYFGGSPQEVREQYQTGSPRLLANAASCPTLLVHGLEDKLVWSRQSERLEARLRDLRVPVTYLSLPWATHGFDFNLAGPGGQLFTQTLRRFLMQVFKQ